MDREQKKNMVKVLIDKFNHSKGVVFTDFKGLSAQEIYGIRRRVSEERGEYKVVKNTLALIAIEKSGEKNLQDFVKGCCGIVFLGSEALSLIKILANFSKENKSFVLKGGLIEGQIIDGERLKEIATLPTKNELLAIFLRDLISPIAHLTLYLNKPIINLIYLLNSIKKA